MYGYVGNDPVSFNDPAGMRKLHDSCAEQQDLSDMQQELYEFWKTHNMFALYELWKARNMLKEAEKRRKEAEESNSLPWWRWIRTEKNGRITLRRQHGFDFSDDRIIAGAPVVGVGG